MAPKTAPSSKGAALSRNVVKSVGYVDSVTPAVVYVPLLKPWKPESLPAKARTLTKAQIYRIYPTRKPKILPDESPEFSPRKPETLPTEARILLHESPNARERPNPSPRKPDESLLTEGPKSSPRKPESPLTPTYLHEIPQIHPQSFPTNIRILPHENHENPNPSPRKPKSPRKSKSSSGKPDRQVLRIHANITIEINLLGWCWVINGFINLA